MRKTKHKLPPMTKEEKRMVKQTRKLFDLATPLALSFFGFQMAKRVLRRLTHKPYAGKDYLTWHPGRHNGRNF